MTAVTSRRGGEVRRGGRAGNEAEQTSFSSSFQKCHPKKERSALKDVLDALVVDKHVAISRGKTLSLSSKLLAVL